MIDSNKERSPDKILDDLKSHFKELEGELTGKVMDKESIKLITDAYENLIRYYGNFIIDNYVPFGRKIQQAERKRIIDIIDQKKKEVDEVGYIGFNSFMQLIDLIKEKIGVTGT